MNSKSLMAEGIIIASLALVGTSAMAANTHVKPSTKTVHVARARPAVHVAGRKPQPRAQPKVDIAQFVQFMLGGLPLQYGGPVHYTGKAAVSPTHSRSSDYSPTYDYSPPADTSVDNSQSQAAIDASDQAMQQEDQSLQDLDASVAAAEQQNDAANAAALQTEINAGM